MTTSDRRPALALGAIFAAFAIERLAYYMFRSVFMMHLVTAQHMTPAEAKGVYTVAAFATVLGLVGGGGATWALGPRVTMVAGLGLAALGHLLGLGAPQLAIFVLGLAAGVVRVAPYAAIAEELELGPDRPSRGVALAATVYAAANVGAMLASSIAGALGSSQGARPVFVVAAVLAALAAGVAALAFLAPRRVPEPAPPMLQPNLEAGYRGVPAVVGGGVPIAWTGVVVSAVALSSGVSIAAVADEAVHHAVLSDRSLSFRTTEALYTVNPVMVIGAAAFVAAVYGYGARSRPSRALGVGLVIVGVGSALAPFLPWPAALLPTVALAAAEPLVSGAAFGVAATRVPPRLAGPFAAGVGALLQMASLFANRLGNALEGSAPVIVVLALLALGAGVAVLAAARPLLEEDPPTGAGGA